MNALLLVAHGSRKDTANAEIAALADKLREAATDWDIVRHAFLEMAEPAVGAGIGACVAEGATRVVLLPYFLAAGRHVAEDVPALVAAAREAHPNIQIESRIHTGGSEELIALLLKQAAGASV